MDSPLQATPEGKRRPHQRNLAAADGQASMTGHVLPEPAGSPATSTATPRMSSEMNDAVRKVHVTLQGKGGVGKSWLSCQIAQYLLEQGRPVVFLDTDPVNPTLSNYKALKAEHVSLMDPDNNAIINARAFDGVMERILTEDAEFVLDNGSSCFLPLSNYLLENPAFEMIAEAGKRVVLHTVVVGGQAFLDTLVGFADLAREMPADVDLIVWANEFFGRVEDPSGKPFEETKAYAENKDRIKAVIRLPRQTADTFGADIHAMMERKLTFKEAIESPDFSIMARQRLKKVRQGVFSQLAAVA